MDSEGNVGETERLISTLGGAALILNAVIRPSTLHTVLALGGIALVRRGLTGHCAVYRALGLDSSAPSMPHKTYGTGKRGARSIAEEIDTAAEHSFPASDPPSWIPHSSVGSPESAH